ncbi:MAG: hypothetical protein ACI4KF_08590 [Huintestinicola sp.]
MYSKKMNEAVQSVQKCIDNCCKEGNISIRAAEDIENFFQLVKELDPKGINFLSSNVFTTLKINGYKRKIEEYMPSIEKSIELLKQDARIAGNTFKTLKAERERFEASAKEFKALEHDDEDREFFQQMIVVDNTSALLNNAIAEYEHLSKRISEICNISAAVFSHSLVSSKISGQIRSTELGAREFQKQYSDLIELFVSFAK